MKKLALIIIPFLLASCLRDHPLLDPDDYSGQPPLLYLQGQIKGRTSAETFGRLVHPRVAFLPLNLPLLYSEYDSVTRISSLGYRILCADTFVGRFPLNYEAACFSPPPDSLFETVVLPTGEKTGILVAQILLIDDRDNDAVLDMVSRDGLLLPASDTIAGRCFDHLLVYCSVDSFAAVRNRYAVLHHNPEDRWTEFAQGFNLARLSDPVLAAGGEYGVRFQGLAAVAAGDPVTLWTDSLKGDPTLFYFQEGSGSRYEPPAAAAGRPKESE